MPCWTTIGAAVTSAASTPAETRRTRHLTAAKTAKAPTTTASRETSGSTEAISSQVVATWASAATTTAAVTTPVVGVLTSAGSVGPTPVVAVSTLAVPISAAVGSTPAAAATSGSEPSETFAGVDQMGLLPHTDRGALHGQTVQCGIRSRFRPDSRAD